PLSSTLFPYTTLFRSELVPALIVQLQPYLVRFGICDAGGCVRVGIALEEAVSNAIHHGNLELSSALREEGTDSYDLLAQARRREDRKSTRLNSSHVSI